jgi:hypothetical protein
MTSSRSGCVISSTFSGTIIGEKELDPAATLIATLPNLKCLRVKIVETYNLAKVDCLKSFKKIFASNVFEIEWPHEWDKNSEIVKEELPFILFETPPVPPPNDNGNIEISYGITNR